MAQHWVEDILHQLGRIHIADEANSLRDLQEIQRTDREVTRAHHQRANEHFDDGGDDMGNIDMSTHHHHEKPAKRSSVLGPAAMALACLASGGVGASIPFLTGLGGGKPPAAAGEQQSDSDTQYGLSLGDPEESE